MKVLMTGNRGYIGMVMSHYLKNEEHDVFGFDMGYFDSCSLNVDQDNTIKTHRTSNDVRDIKSEDLDGFDAIIYLAALSNDPLGEIKKSVTYDINWISAVKTAMLAREAGVKRFLFASSCSMYGDGGGAEFLTEESPQRPLTTYAESKVWAEKGISNLASDDFSPVFFRCGTAYGVSPRQRLDLVLNSMVASAYLTGKIVVYNGGVAWRPVVHIEDISQAFGLGLIAPKNLIHNQAFNVGVNEDNHRVRNLAERVKSGVGNCEIHNTDTGADTRSYKVSFDKIKTVLGFEPLWYIGRGITQLSKSFEENDLKLFPSNKFIRLHKIREMMDLGTLDEDLRWTE